MAEAFSSTGSGELERRMATSLQRMRTWLARLEDHRGRCQPCAAARAGERGRAALCPIGEELYMRYCRAYYARHQATVQLRKRQLHVTRLGPVTEKTRFSSLDQKPDGRSARPSGSDFPARVRRVPCPDCGAQPGEPCSSPRLHQRRISLWKRTGGDRG